MTEPNAYFSTGPASPFARLPAHARRKLEAIQDERDELLVLIRASNDRAQHERTRLYEAQAHLRRWQEAHDTGAGAYARRRDGAAVIAEPNVRQAAEIQARIDEARANLDRLAAANLPREERAQELGRLIDNLAKWLRTVPEGVPLQQAAPVATEVRKGETTTAALDRVRTTIMQLKAERAAIKAAPVPSADLKPFLRQFVQNVAERGRPNLFELIEGGRSIVIPRAAVSFPVTVTGSAGKLDVSAVGAAHGELVDPVALLAWMDPAAMLKRLEAELAAVADDDAALDVPTRRKKLQQNADAALHAERAEESLVMRALDERLDVQRRADCDPRAVLELDATGLPGVEH